MSTSFNPAFLPKRTTVGRKYENTYRLWLKGHRIEGKTAWRIQSGEFALPYTRKHTKGRRLRHHYKYPAGQIWVNFTSEDFVYVRQKDGSDKKYHRVWWLPFLAQVWMASRFDLWGTFTRLREWYGLRVGRNYGIRYLKAALYGHLPEIKEYILATKKKNLDDYFEKFDTNIEWLESVRDGDVVDANLEAAKLQQRLDASSTINAGLGRIISVFKEAEAKKQETTDHEKQRQELLSAIREHKPDTDRQPKESV